MSIVYGDKDKYTGKPIPYHEINATKGYLRHAENHAYLDFIHKNSKDFHEKAQASHEMGIARKKMDWHKHHPNFDMHAATHGVSEIKKKWTSK